MVGESGGEIASDLMEDVASLILDFESSFEKRTAFGTLEEEGATDEGCTAVVPQSLWSTDGGGAMVKCGAVAE